MKVIKDKNSGNTFIELNEDEAHSLEKMLGKMSIDDYISFKLCKLEAKHIFRLFKCLNNGGGQL